MSDSLYQVELRRGSVWALVPGRIGPDSGNNWAVALSGEHRVQGRSWNMRRSPLRHWTWQVTKEKTSKLYICQTWACYVVMMPDYRVKISLFACRAPVLVATALIELGMKYEDAVDLIRKKRRGAINAKQLEFLSKYKRRKYFIKVGIHWTSQLCCLN